LLPSAVLLLLLAVVPVVLVVPALLPLEWWVPAAVISYTV
jgi:hypothetical protein